MNLTPMIDAGAAELLDYVVSDVGPEFRKEIAVAAYEVMEGLRGYGICENKTPGESTAQARALKNDDSRVSSSQ
jgi:hypothetical protein